jgi:isopentenyl-diphosphate delta-isomerase
MSENENQQTLSDRKSDHIDLTQRSQVLASELNRSFDYEPLLAGFPSKDCKLKEVTIGSKTLKTPLWISSMTGGTGASAHVNRNLAKVCQEFGLGMGLGSCRSLLESDEYFKDFALRKILGDSCPFYANIGIAQVAKMLDAGNFSDFIDLCHKLEVDGLFIHINPLQEWYQPEGDRWERSPLDMIDEVLNFTQKAQLSLCVKEVGQGMGPKSLEQLLIRPLASIEFAAFGGTNFSYLEALRAENSRVNLDLGLCFVGHSAGEMLTSANRLITNLGHKVRCESLIISGGIRSYLQGHSLIESSLLPAAYGMAGAFLEVARKGESETRDFVQEQVDGLKMAGQFLRVRKE